MNKWINTKTCLPSIGQEILFWHPVNELQRGYYHADGFQVWFNGQCEIFKNVTYWQPLPKPPYLKEGQKPSLTQAWLGLYDNQNNLIQSMSIPDEDFDFIVPTDETDEVAERVIRIKNFLYLIDLLFVDMRSDLLLISEEHFDGNGKELAQGLEKEIGKLHDMVTEGIEPTSEWQHNTPYSTLCLLASNESQHLVIPEMRKMYEELSKDDKHLSANAKKEELESWVKAIKEQYGLGENFK